MRPDRGFRFRVPGWGQVNWRRVITALVSVGYDYVMSFEHEDLVMSPEDGAEKAIAYLRLLIIKKPLTFKAMRETGKLFAINWPLAWYPPHVTAKHLIEEGAIGEVIEVHFYDGNRGPLYHTADKVELSPAECEREKPFTWFYKKEAGGGSLLDYLGLTHLRGFSVALALIKLNALPAGARSTR